MKTQCDTTCLEKLARPRLVSLRRAQEAKEFTRCFLWDDPWRSDRRRTSSPFFRIELMNCLQLGPDGRGPVALTPRVAAAAPFAAMRGNTAGALMPDPAKLELQRRRHKAQTPQAAPARDATPGISSRSKELLRTADCAE